VEPAAADAKTPLVIALHGRGDTAEGFARLAMQLRLDARIIVGEAPRPFGNIGGRQWYETGAAEAGTQVRQRVADLGVLIDKLAKLYPEAGKPALYGFSQGAVVALQAAHEIPDRLAAVAALSGFLMSEDGAASPTTPLPVLVTAGTKDGIITQDRSWAAADVLEKQGLAVERFAFQGPHGVPPAVAARVKAFLTRR
jgi:predicted esterase